MLLKGGDEGRQTSLAPGTGNLEPRRPHEQTCCLFPTYYPRPKPLSSLQNVLFLCLKGIRAPRSGHYIGSSFSYEGFRAPVKVQHDVCAFLLSTCLCEFNFQPQPGTPGGSRKTFSLHNRSSLTGFPAPTHANPRGPAPVYFPSSIQSEYFKTEGWSGCSAARGPTWGFCFTR